MNKAELLAAVEKQTKLRPSYVKRAVDAIFDPVDGVIAKQLKKGSKVTIAGFGTFDTRTHKARQVKSPFVTGNPVSIGKRRLPGFRAGVSLKAKLR
jgi:DNA-binding protein HU-beta